MEIEEEDANYIHNNFDSKPKDITSIEELQKKILAQLLSDFKHFISKVKPNETLAIASTSKEDFHDFGCFEGAGSYLTTYIWLLNFLRSLDSANNNITDYILQYKDQGFNEKDLLKRAETSYQSLLVLLHSQEKKDKKIQISYYFGGPGLYLNGCLLSYLSNNPEGFHDNLKSLMNYKSLIHSKLDKYYKEVLYGVSGYLYCLLVIQKLLQREKENSSFYMNLEKHIEDTVNIIIDEGIKSFDPETNINHLPQNFRLVYTFHDTEYFGAAHGLFGVLYIIMNAYELNHSYFNQQNPTLAKKLIITVKASLNYLLKFQMSNGNFPSRKKTNPSPNSSVQFCHGSPGSVHCLLLSSEVFKGEKLAEDCLKSALLAGENIWQQGILKKGHGLCHGISGNGYGFLAIYRHTGDKTWLYRAYCFAVTKDVKHYKDQIENYDFEDRFKVGISDYPYSLMLGLSGDICYEVDCLFPNQAKFPGYEI